VGQKELIMRLILFFSLLLLISCSTSDNTKINSATKKSDPIPEPITSFNPQQYVCYQTDKPLKIDGKMKEAIWSKAQWTRDFRDIEGDSKPVPRFRTRAKMLWDKEYFYVFTEMEEPDVWAKLVQRDTVIFYDNDFEVFIDPNGDTHRYYELEINAFGTEWDLFLDQPYRDDARPLFHWNIGGLKSATHINGTINRPGDKDEGWSLEIAIPWAVLKEAADKDAPPSNGDQWRVNFSRVEWKTEVKNGKYRKVINPATSRPFPEDNWVWSPQGVINMHYPELWGFVQFTDKIAGTDEETFKYRQEEDAKWALRQVYYRQKNYYSSHGAFTQNIADLNLADYQIKGYNWPPEIETTTNLYEAVLQSEDKSETWLITQNGMVRKR